MGASKPVTEHPDRGAAGPTATPATPLLVIQSGTAALHRVLDHQSLLADWITRPVTLTCYREGLAALFAVYRCVDQQLVAADRVRPAALPEYLPRAPLLAQDLMGLGITPEWVAPIDNSRNWPATASAYVGARYVVEGAQLGTFTLRQGLKRSPAWQTIAPASRFFAARPHDHNGWLSILRFLKTTGSVDDEPAAKEAAKQVFRLFIDHLCTHTDQSA